MEGGGEVQVWDEVFEAGVLGVSEEGEWLGDGVLEVFPGVWGV